VPNPADTPIACTLTPDALQTRRDGLLADLLRRATPRELTDNGLRVSFSPQADTVARARVVDAERHGCRFRRFVITVEPGGGPWLFEVSGPGGTREFIDGLLDQCL
jgi:hypothetical protein